MESVPAAEAASRFSFSFPQRRVDLELKFPTVSKDFMFRRGSRRQNTARWAIPGGKTDGQFVFDRSFFRIWQIQDKLSAEFDLVRLRNIHAGRQALPVGSPASD